MTTVTGYIRDQEGDLLADAVVRLYRRDTGAILGSAVSGDGSEAVDGDTDYASVSLLLHCDGTDGSTTFTDSGPTGHTIGVSGGAHVETDSFKFGASSLYCDGDGDYLSLPISSDFEFGSGDFTIEFFLKTSTTKSYGCMIGRDTGAFVAGSWALLLNGTGSGQIQFWCGSYATNQALLSSSTAAAINDNNWNHIALVRYGSTFTIYKNGTSIATGTWSGSIATLNNAIRIGAEQGYSRDIAAYFDEIRITKGVARYTADFTPPAAAFLDYSAMPARPLGQYNIDTTYSGEVQRIVCAPDAWDPIANDLIDRIILP